MTIYADVLVIVNLYIDFCLLWCVEKFLALGAKRKKGRLVLGAAAGALCSLTALIPRLPSWASLLFGFLSALGVTAATFAPMALKMFFRALFCFWSFSMVLAGFTVFLLRFFAPPRVAVLGSVVYFDLSPGLLFLCTCGAYGILAGARRLLPAAAQGLRCRWLVVENLGSRRRIYAKADTGNALREPFSGLPVLVCQADSLKGCTPEAVQDFLRTGGAGSGTAPGLRLIPFETVGGAGLLPAFRPEKVTVEQTGAVLDCYVAACCRALSAGQFDAIYNPDLF